MKASATSAFPFLVRIVENELTANLIFSEVHLSTDHCHQSFTIYYYLQSLSFDNLIELFDLLLLYIVHVICKSITSFFAERYLDSYQVLWFTLWHDLSQSIFCILSLTLKMMYDCHEVGFGVWDRKEISGFR